MQKYSDVVLDKNGKAVAGATVAVVTYPDSQPATIYAADGGPAVPSVLTDSAGRFSFYAANGHYSITVSGQGITPITYNDITLFDPKDLAAAGGAALVGFQQAGAGAAVRTAQEKLRDVVHIRDFGASPSNSASMNSAAFNAAFSALGGSDRGYGMPPAALVLDGTYAFSGDLLVPVNVSLIAPKGAALVGTGVVKWQNPNVAGGAHGYTEYWPFMRSINYNIDFQCPVVVNVFIGAAFDYCSFGDPLGAFVGLTLSNTNNLWTERTRLNACFLRSGNSGTVIRATSNASDPTPANRGTSSFAYTELHACTVSLSGSAKLFDVIDGATLYGAKLQVRGNATGTSVLFNTNSASIKDSHFDVRVEDDTAAGSPKLFALSGGQFWNNKGSATLPSYNFSCSEAGGVTFRDNAVYISGATFSDYWGGGVTPSGSAAFTTIANVSVIKRKPANLQYVDLFHPGAMTCAPNAAAASASQFLGCLPNGATRIARVEIRARTASSGNLNGKFYFDLRSGIGSGSFQYPLALTSLYLTDGNQVANFSVDIDVSSGNDWILMAKPTDIAPAGSNAGTPPADVSMRVYFV